MKTARDEGTGGYHPLHWLLHSYLQIGRADEAEKLLAVLEEDGKTIVSAYNRTHLAMSRATLLVEARGKGPASIMTTVDGGGMRSFGAFSNHDLAIGLEYLRRNDLAEAGRTLESLRAKTAAGRAARTLNSQHEFSCPRAQFFRFGRAVDFCSTARGEKGRTGDGEAFGASPVLAPSFRMATASGLLVTAAVDERIYPTRVRVTDAEMNELRLRPHDICPQWNYTISPRRSYQGD